MFKFLLNITLVVSSAGNKLVLGWGRSRETSNDIFTTVVQKKKWYMATSRNQCVGDSLHITKIQSRFLVSAYLGKYKYYGRENYDNRIE